MKYASDFRSIARDALRGRWGIAVVAGLIAALLGGAASSGPEINVNVDGGGFNANFEFAGQTVYSTATGINPQFSAIIAGGVTLLVAAALVMAVVYFILGSIIKVGYSRFNLDLVDRQKEAELSTMFGYFPRWRTTAMAELLQFVYVLLWSLLFVIPGIIAGYSYAMTGFILAEHPEMSAREALSRSKEMMEGNRWRLFCLEFSFVGWVILCAFTLGIGNLFLTPYRAAAKAAFYRDLRGQNVSE